LSRGWLAGDVVEVRRSSDGDLDSFTQGQIDSGAMLDWVTEHSATADGYVSRLYDQSGFGNDATQPVTTSQPKIVDAGALVAGGIDFDGVDDFLANSDLSLGAENFSLFAIAMPDAIGVSSIVNLRDSFASGGAYFATPEVAVRCNGGITWVSSSPMTIATDNILTAIQATGNLHTGTSMWLDGAPVARTGGGDGALASPSGNLIIGSAYVSGSNIYDGKIREIIIYPSDQSANRVGIESNINNRHNIF
jgi:hypothetical protein